MVDGFEVVFGDVLVDLLVIGQGFFYIIVVGVLMVFYGDVGEFEIYCVGFIVLLLVDEMNDCGVVVVLFVEQVLNVWIVGEFCGYFFQNLFQCFVYFFLFLSNLCVQMCVVGKVDFFFVGGSFQYVMWYVIGCVEEIDLENVDVFFVVVVVYDLLQWCVGDKVVILIMFVFNFDWWKFWWQCV